MSASGAKSGVVMLFSVSRGLIVAGLAGRREHVRVHRGRSHPAVDLGLHSDRSNQRDGNSNPTQDEPECPEPFLVGHP